MEICSHQNGDHTFITLQGRLDAAWSPSVSAVLQEVLHGGCHHISLNLSQVPYLSSAGIRVLLVVAKQLKGIGGQLHIVEPSAAVQEVLRMVGFHTFLESSTVLHRASMGAAPPTPQKHSHSDYIYETYELEVDAVLQGTLITSGEDYFSRSSQSDEQPAFLRIFPHTFTVGLGALGRSQIERAGELLAAEGLAVVLPGYDPLHPDWLVSEGEWVPEVTLFRGIHAQGSFRTLVRFGIAPDDLPLGIYQLSEALLSMTHAQSVGIVAVAETASLVGAALQVPPQELQSDWFRFPEIRDRMLFTAEPAHADQTCLIVGCIARHPTPPLTHFLRPMKKNSELHGHFHAAVVPYRPVHKGYIPQRETLFALLESQTVRGVLHLLNDDREGVGAGESYLRRGAVWCSPLHFDPMAIKKGLLV